jgi:hypothetical protein
MFRVEYPSGTISDMANLSRAKDAAIYIVMDHLNKRTAKAATEPAGLVIPSSGVQYLPQATELTYASSAL